MPKLLEAYSYDFSKLTLVDGSKIEGQPWDLCEATNDDGDGLGFDILTFEVEGIENPLILKEEDVIEVEELRK